MATVLHIDSSPRGNESVSRKISKQFVERWTAAHPEDKVIYRDLGKHAIPVLTQEWIAAAYTPPVQRTAVQQHVLAHSEQLVDELLSADVIVLGAPMHNFHIPSNLKAYIDQVVRIGRTFRYTGPGQVEGLAKGKKLFLITSRGGDFRPGTGMEAFNHQDPYLRTVFGFIGITDVTFINAEAQANPTVGPQCVHAALEQVQQLAV
jgi:FMN-dependent NADH-azoreductase